MSYSTNLNLKLYHPGVDREASFETIRLGINGTVNSNMMKIDSLSGSLTRSIAATESTVDTYYDAKDAIIIAQSASAVAAAASVALTTGRIVKLGEFSGSGQANFSSISQDYTHLFIMGTTAGSSTSGSIALGCDFNGESGSSNYQTIQWYGSSAESMESYPSIGAIMLNTINGYNSGSTGYASPVFAVIPNYSGSCGFYKVACGFSAIYMLLSPIYQASFQGGLYLSASAITDMRLFGIATNSYTRIDLMENTIISLFGIY